MVERVGFSLSDKGKSFLKPYIAIRMVYRRPDECPEHTVPYLNRDQLKAIGYYPNSEECSRPGRRNWHLFVMIKATIFFGSVTYAIFESLDNNVEWGRDLAFIIAILNQCYGILTLLLNTME
ncbi:GL14095 [Drosophila persimilis]|uniref:GL14095 n=1 Tax=Drosophila persimilis TaxID=7234 RepID=B4H8B1_DROPE|nr:GL14095 [Drosophila persimilis]